MVERCLNSALAIALIACSSLSLVNAAERPETATETWLDLQRSGELSVREHKRVEGEMTQRAYRRLLDSFERAEPADRSPSTETVSPFGK